MRQIVIWRRFSYYRVILILQNRARAGGLLNISFSNRWKNPQQGQGWARDGLTNEQIAHNMGITSETLRVWNNKYSAISAALKKGKEVVGRQVLKNESKKR